MGVDDVFTLSYKGAPEEIQVEVAEIDLSYQLLSETNRTITVIDDLADPSAEPVELGMAVWNSEGAPVEFSYRLDIAADGDRCGVYTNVASIVETEQAASIDVQFCVETPALPVAPATPVDSGPPAAPHRPASAYYLPKTGVAGSSWLLALGSAVLLAGEVHSSAADAAAVTSEMCSRQCPRENLRALSCFPRREKLP